MPEKKIKLRVAKKIGHGPKDKARHRTEKDTEKMESVLAEIGKAGMTVDRALNALKNMRKERRGRPYVESGDRREVVVTFRMTAEERERLHALASKHKVSVSKILRALLNRHGKDFGQFMSDYD